MFGLRGGTPRAAPDLVTTDLPVLAAILIALSAVLSLITIIAIYREGGILKRLRATPLRSQTILIAHVIVKLLFTALTLLAMLLAGRRYYPANIDAPFLSFGLALLFSTFSIISIGFLIASVVPTARFAQPVGTLILYPMLGVSGLFLPITALPPPAQVIARIVPLTYVVSLLRGIWRGEGWAAHLRATELPSPSGGGGRDRGRARRPAAPRFLRGKTPELRGFGNDPAHRLAGARMITARQIRFQARHGRIDFHQNFGT